MKSIPVGLFSLLFLISGCFSSPNNKQKNVLKNKKSDTTTLKENSHDSLSDNGCVFDTSAYKFTTEKLIQFDRNISFSWNNKEQQAVVKIPGNDTLIVHIGG